MELSPVKIWESNDAMFLSGFFSGIFSEIGFNKQTAEKPFVTLFRGSIIGMFTGYGSYIVSLLLPYRIKPIIPFLTGSTILFSKGKEILDIYYKNKDNSS